MKDLTKDSVTTHLWTMAMPVALGMVALIAYQLIDLYFVSQIGDEATAGVSAAGNAMLVYSALAQVLGVGTVALVSHAMGRKDQIDAHVIFNQSLTLTLLCAGITTTLFYVFLQPYVRSLAADDAAVQAGATFMQWLLPGLALMLPFAVLNAALRGIGIVGPSIQAYVLTVAINVLLAPVLIAGWGTGMALGVRGAGLATSLSMVVGNIYLALRFHRLQHAMAIEPAHMRPDFTRWRGILTVGLPAGADYALMFLGTAVIYYAIRDLGADAQAGFGIGNRILQALLLPGMAIAIAAAPIAGQNFAAGNAERVRETFYTATWLMAALMLITTLFVQWQPTALLSPFGASPEALAVATRFMAIMSWTLLAQGLVSTCTAIFQGLGNTLPSLMSALMRCVALTIAAVWLSSRPSFPIEHLWYFAAAAVALQMLISLGLLWREFRRSLHAVGSSAPAPGPPDVGIAV